MQIAQAAGKAQRSFFGEASAAASNLFRPDRAVRNLLFNLAQFAILIVDKRGKKMYNVYVYLYSAKERFILWEL